MITKSIHPSCGYVYQEIKYYSNLSHKLSGLHCYSEVDETIGKFVFCYNWANQIMELTPRDYYDH